MDFNVLEIVNKTGNANENRTKTKGKKFAGIGERSLF